MRPISSCRWTDGWMEGVVVVGKVYNPCNCVGRCNPAGLGVNQTSCSMVSNGMFTLEYLHEWNYQYRGSAIARIVGKNAKKHPEFEDVVSMWVFEEMVNGKKLTEIINTTHVNEKYLPGHTLPDNVVAIPEVAEAAKGARLLIFVLPHQFVPKYLSLNPCEP
nr:glycerol-3-phosphate dehydrogenase [NAD(+)], cytoplasmic-like [Lytechinus pictus]